MRVGILGGGQLGRMLALAGYPLGIESRLLDPAADAAAGQVAEHIAARYDDEQALARFADGLDALTYEFENVPAACLESLRKRGLDPSPSVDALRTSQDRLCEKESFLRLGVPTAPFLPVDDRAGLRRAIQEIGLPAVLKTRRLGYDGRGQYVCNTLEQAEDAFLSMPEGQHLLERFIPFDRELSIIAVRDCAGETAFYPLVQNHHEQGILRLSIAPAPEVDKELQDSARSLASHVLDDLAYVGVLAIELFHHEGRLLANEMAPRVHNSGHWSIEGAVTSQFENHLRAIVGWPLGSTAMVGHSAMVNLLGAPPPSASILAIPGAHLHLYGKLPAKRRKIGHVTLVSSDKGRLRSRLRRLMGIVTGTARVPRGGAARAKRNRG